MLKQYIQFKLGEQSYAVEMSCVREILKPVKVLKLLGAPEFVQGVAKVRDSVITIIDLRKKFGILDTNSENEEPRIVVLECQAESIGLWVNDVVEILETDTIEKIPSIVHYGTITEIIKLEAELIPILNGQRLFTEKVAEWLSSEDRI